MSIADKLAQLTDIRGGIRSALEDKGISASYHDFADFASDIEDIQTGGGNEGYALVPYNSFWQITATATYNGGNI